MKRKFLTLCLCTALLGGISYTSAYTVNGEIATDYNGTEINADLNAAKTPDHIVLSFTQNPETSETVTWRTISSNKDGKIEYREKGTSEWKSIDNIKGKVLTSKTGKSETDYGKENIYSVTISNLNPGTEYEYKVIGKDSDKKEYESSISTFKTEEKNNDDTKFIVFGDSQSGIPQNPEYTPWHNTVTEAYKENPDTDFFINMGDLVEIGENYQHWNNWFKAADGVINNVPEMPVQGNHETYSSNDFASSSPKDFVNQFSVPDNGEKDLIGQTYSYDYGDVHFVVLDSQEDEEAPDNDEFLENQAKWLDEDLSKNTQKWTIVMFHKTPYYNKKARNNPAVKDILNPVIEKHKVDVVFNGHDHGISRTYAMNGDTYNTDYSDGTVYYVTGRSGNKYYTDLNSKVWDASFIDCQDSPCYQVVDIKDGKLNIDSYKYNIIDTSLTNTKNVLYDTPTKVDSFTIDKDNPENSTKLNLKKYDTTKLSIAGTIQNDYDVTVDNNKAYINPQLIADYYGGTYDAASMSLKVNDKSYNFSKSDALNNDSSKICVDALYKAGIDVSYNKDLNVILVDFTGRVTKDMITSLKGITVK